MGTKLNFESMQWLPLAIGGGVVVAGILSAFNLRLNEQAYIHTILKLETNQFAKKIEDIWSDRLLVVQHLADMVAHEEITTLLKQNSHRHSDILFEPYRDTVALFRLDTEGDVQDIITRSERDLLSLESSIQAGRYSHLLQDFHNQLQSFEDWQQRYSSSVERYEEWMVLYVPIVRDRTLLGAMVAVFDCDSQIEEAMELSALGSIAAVTISSNNISYWNNGLAAASGEVPFQQNYSFGNYLWKLTAFPKQSDVLNWHSGSFALVGGSLFFGPAIAIFIALWQESQRRYREVLHINQQFDREIESHKLARTDLSVSQQQLQTVLDNSHSSIFLKDLDLRYVLVNRQFAQQCGLESEQILGKRDSDLFPAWMSEKFETNDRTVIESGYARCFEEQGIYKMRHRTELTSLAPLKTDRGKVYGLCGISTDITEQKRKAQQEQVISSIAQHIRSSLDLAIILQSTVDEVRNFLECDRALVYEFDSKWNGSIAFESIKDGVETIVGENVNDSCLPHATCIEAYAKGLRTQAVADIYDADLDECYFELLTRFGVRANLVVPILAGSKLWGLLIAHQCSSPHHWEVSEVALLQKLSTQVGIAIQQSQLYRQAQKQAHQQLILNQLIRSIRDSLDTDFILQHAADSLRAAFNASRCCIGLCNPNDSDFQVDYTSCLPDVPDIKNAIVPIDGNPHAQKVITTDEVVADDNVQQSNLIVGKVLEKATELNIEAMLATSIRIKERSIGVITIHQCDGTRNWTDDEKCLLKQAADHLGVAIRQAGLYDQVQQLNEGLEQKVEERTLQVRKGLIYEATLKRITDKVRDSLDENQILQTALQELATALQAFYCDTAIYDTERKIIKITHEFRTIDCSELGQEISNAEFSERYHQLQNKDSFQFCELSPRSNRPIAAVLSLPIYDERLLLGNIWVLRSAELPYDESEIRLAKQVANQCAIAIRQARLFQDAKKRVEELDRLNLLKDDFLSTVSHEMRSPISNIKVSLDMLALALKRRNTAKSEREVNRAEEKINQYMHVLETECEREIDLIDDLLDLQRLEAGTEIFNWEPIDLNEWLPHLLCQFKDRAEQRHQHFFSEVPQDMPILISDMRGLQRILTELLTNACKYTPPNDCITFKVTAIADCTQLQVINTGVEIPEDEIPSIFNKFYRIVSVDRWKQGGTGLGLALIQRLTTEMGGSISVTSQNNQTSFVVALPNRPETMELPELEASMA